MNLGLGLQLGNRGRGRGAALPTVSQALIYVVGDSIPAGFGTTGGNSPVNGSSVNTTAAAFPNVVRNQLLGPLSWFSNASLSGVDTDYLSNGTIVSGMAAMLTNKRGRNGVSNPIVVIHLGHNGPKGGPSYGAAATLADIRTAATSYRALGWKVLVCGVLPDGVTSGFESFRVALNSGLSSGVSTYFDAYCDFDTVPEVFLTSDTTYYQADKVHPTNALHALLAPVFRTALSTLFVPTTVASPYTPWDATYKNAAVTLSGSNYIATGGSGFKGTRSARWRDSGKYYAEIKATTNLDLMVGVVDACNDNTDYPGQVQRGLGAWLTSGMFILGFTAVNAPTMTGGSTAGTITKIAIDFDAGKLWMARDGNAYPGSGNPATGANPSYTFDPNTRLHLVYSGNTASAVAALPTGAGDFVYSAPSGFLPF